MIRVDSSICRSFSSTAAMYMAQSVDTCSVVPSANDIWNIAGLLLAVFCPLTSVFWLLFSSLNIVSSSASSCPRLVTSAAHSRLRSRFFWIASSVFKISSGCGSSAVEFAHHISWSEPDVLSRNVRRAFARSTLAMCSSAGAVSSKSSGL